MDPVPVEAGDRGQYRDQPAAARAVYDPGQRYDTVPIIPMFLQNPRTSGASSARKLTAQAQCAKKKTDSAAAHARGNAIEARIAHTGVNTLHNSENISHA
jgi:hypothetical protein